MNAFTLQDERRFEIRVWRKVGDKMRLIPNPSNDVTIGLASIDLSVLIAGLPLINGWFNIIDHSGCINGQLKVSSFNRNLPNSWKMDNNVNGLFD